MSLNNANTYPPGEEWRATWKTKPVNIVDFCKYFLREPLWPRQEVAALQIWGDDPNVWRNPNLPTKLLLQWGKGSGKDRTVAKNVDFAGYRLTNLINPWFYFQKPPGDPIDFINVSFNAEQAKDVFFKHLKAMMRKTINPETGKNWFGEMGIDLREGKRNIQARSIVLVPGGSEDENLITIHAGDSKTYTGEGMNLIGALFDELGVYTPVDRQSNCSTRFGTRPPHDSRATPLSWASHTNTRITTQWRSSSRPQKKLSRKTWTLAYSRPRMLIVRRHGM
jgi:hypothetical protein